jgi:hypothetical protein
MIRVFYFFLETSFNFIAVMISSKIRLYLYYFVLLVLSLGAFYVFEYVTRTHPSDYLFTEKCVLCIISSFFNMFVLFYHFTRAPHPKYVMLPQRRFAIYTHILSGGVEFTSCWTAFCTGNESVDKLAALAAILGHVPSAYYQTSIAFGAKALTVSGYLFTISLHLFCALHLFMEPSSTYWLLNMFLVHNIYVWCRIFYFFFSSVGVFKDSIYTNSILTSCLILFPAVLGVSANLLFLGYVATSIILYFAIVQPNEADRVRFISERSREILVSKDIHSNWLKEKTRLLNIAKDTHLTEHQKARQVFDLLDADKNGYIDGEEINSLLKDWQTAESFMKRFSRGSKKGEVSYENFFKNIWRLSENSISHVKEGETKVGMARARFIFDCLDQDGNGYIDTIELQKLLFQWGLPDSEVDAYLATDDDKRYSFDEFYQNLKPIWDFAYENMNVRDVGQVAETIHQHSN